MEVIIRQCLKCMKIFDDFLEGPAEKLYTKYDDNEYRCPRCGEIISVKKPVDGISKLKYRDENYIELKFEL